MESHGQENLSIHASEKFWLSRDRPHHRVTNVKKPVLICVEPATCLTWPPGLLGRKNNNKAESFLTKL